MKVVVNTRTGRVITWVRWGTPNHDPDKEIVLPVDREVDIDNEVWDGANGVRPKNQAEKDADYNAEVDALVADPDFVAEADIFGLDPVKRRALAQIRVDRQLRRRSR